MFTELLTGTISRKIIQRFINKNMAKYAVIPSLNKTLYIHFKNGCREMAQWMKHVSIKYERVQTLKIHVNAERIWWFINHSSIGKVEGDHKEQAG